MVQGAPSREMGLVAQMWERLSKQREQRESRPGGWETQVCWEKCLAGARYMKGAIKNTFEKVSWDPIMEGLGSC